MTLNEIRDQFAEYKKDISDVSSTLFINWMNDIANYIYREMQKADPEVYVSELTFSQSTNSRSLPADFRSLVPENTGIFYNDNNGNITDRRLPITHPGSQDIGYYIYQTEIRFTPVDWGQNIPFTLRYIPKRTQFTSQEDYFTLDTLVDGIEIIKNADEYMDYLLKALDVQYDQWDEDVNQEGIADIRYTRALDDLLENIRPEPKAYYIDDYSTMY